MLHAKRFEALTATAGGEVPSSERVCENLLASKALAVAPVSGNGGMIDTAVWFIYMQYRCQSYTHYML